jgi:hypothetical protein
MNGTRIMEGRPWLFDGNLVALAEFNGLTPPAKLNFDNAAFWIRIYNLPLACMGKVTGEKIGSSVGLVEEVDVYNGDAGWGEYLRAKIVIDMTKPLARGRMLHIQGHSNWVAFRYEKLPEFCFDCSIIKHDHQGCHKPGNKSKAKTEEAQLYGPWLRVQYPTRRRMAERIDTVEIVSMVIQMEDIIISSLETGMKRIGSRVR